MSEENLWQPIWREDWRDTSYLLPKERHVWDRATDAWVYKFAEILGQESPFAIVETVEGGAIIIPRAVTWHAGIGPPDPVPENLQGRRFVQLMTQIRIPILFETREASGKTIEDLLA